MDAQQYRAALATLGLTQKAAGEWLGVSEKTAKRYATTGPSGPAARAMNQALIIKKALTELEHDCSLTGAAYAQFTLSLAAV